MFIENEFTGTLTVLQLVLGLVMGLAPIAVTIWIKLFLYRRRLAEDDTLRDEVRKVPSNHAVRRESPGRRSARTRRRMRLGRPLTTTFNADRPLALFATETRRGSTRPRQDN